MGKNIENRMQGPEPSKHSFLLSCTSTPRSELLYLWLKLCVRLCVIHILLKQGNLFLKANTDLVYFHHCVPDMSVIYKFEIIRVSVTNTDLNMLIFLSDDIKVSVNDFIIRAAAVTLKVSGHSKLTVASKCLLA